MVVIEKPTTERTADYLSFYLPLLLPHGVRVQINLQTGNTQQTRTSNRVETICTTFFLCSVLSSTFHTASLFLPLPRFLLSSLPSSCFLPPLSLSLSLSPSPRSINRSDLVSATGPDGLVVFPSNKASLPFFHPSFLPPSRPHTFSLPLHSPPAFSPPILPPSAVSPLYCLFILFLVCSRRPLSIPRRQLLVFARL